MSTPTAEIHVQATIPDKEPYEGTATEKQKQLIWELGYRDRTVIDKLGKKQAGFLINTIVSKHKGARSARNGRRMLIIGGTWFVLAIGAMFLGRFWHAWSESGVVTLFGVLGLIVGPVMALYGAARLATASKSSG